MDKAGIADEAELNHLSQSSLFISLIIFCSFYVFWIDDRNVQNRGLGTNRSSVSCGSPVEVQWTCCSCWTILFRVTYTVIIEFSHVPLLLLILVLFTHIEKKRPIEHQARQDNLCSVTWESQNKSFTCLCRPVWLQSPSLVKSSMHWLALFAI